MQPIDLYRFRTDCITYLSQSSHFLQDKVQLPQPRSKSFPHSAPPFLLHLPISVLQHKPPPGNPITLSLSQFWTFRLCSSSFFVLIYSYSPTHSFVPIQIIPTLYDLVPILSLLKGMPNHSKEQPSYPPHTFHPHLLYNSLGCILPWLLNCLGRALGGVEEYMGT